MEIEILANLLEFLRDYLKIYRENRVFLKYKNCSGDLKNGIMLKNFFYYII